MRPLLACMSNFALASSLLCLIGCGNGFHGTLDEGASSAVPNPGRAQIASASPSTFVAGSAAVTLSVTGHYFIPSTVVMWNSTPLTTTYVSSTALTAQVPTALLGGVGVASIIPSPVLGQNYGVTVQVTAAPLTGNPSFTVSQISLAANDMAASAGSSDLYLAMSSEDPVSPDTLTAFDPATSQFGASVATTAEPSLLALSADGDYAYASFNSTYTIQRFLLPTLTPDITIPVGSASQPQYLAADLQVQPTNSHAVAVARVPNNTTYGNVSSVTLYSDTTPLPQSASSGDSIPIDSIAWNASGQTLYGDQDPAGASFLYLMSSGSQGLANTSTVTSADGFGGRFHSDPVSGGLYTDRGEVFDPLTGIAIGSFATGALQGGFGGMPLMVPDGRLGIAYFLGRTIAAGASSSYVIEAFSLTDYHLLGTASLSNVTGVPFRFVRWGSNGLAFLTTDPQKTGSATGLYLVSGDFVTSPAAP